MDQKNLVSNTTKQELMEMVDWTVSEVPVSHQAELLDINRSSLYYKLVQPSQVEVAIKNRMDEIFPKCPYFGWRKIAEILNAKGETINRKKVQHHMREMGIKAVYPGPNLSKRNLQHRVYPYLLRGLSISHPNQVWSIDITYIRLQHSWMYLTAVIDW